MATAFTLPHVPAPNVALTDPQTGLVGRDWYSYLASLRLVVPVQRPVTPGLPSGPVPTEGGTLLRDFADDTAAAAGGVPVNGLYRTGSIIKIRVT